MLDKSAAGRSGFEYNGNQRGQRTRPCDVVLNQQLSHVEGVCWLNARCIIAVCATTVHLGQGERRANGMMALGACVCLVVWRVEKFVLSCSHGNS
jgi:hypothetical protein